MKNEINLLSPQLINKIAAGEVVERPASIVKELVENSIDAGADQIKIEIEKGGINLIKVTDNGKGMNEVDLKLAFVQHATSKIKSEKDLVNILSMGFRGEALASISSVSNTTIYSATKEGQANLSKKSDNGSIEVTTSPKSHQGTIVTVRNLFKTVPARRKFLRSEATEYKYISDIITKIAISNPNIQFELIKDKKQQFKYKTTSSKERIRQIYNNDKISQLIDVFFDDTNLKVSGFIGHPRDSQKRKNLQFLFINHRPINDSLISKAIKDGYGTTLMNHMHPPFFIFIEISPQSVDVNVHPRKEQVKFEDPQNIYKTLYKATKKALEKELQEQKLQQLLPTERATQAIPSRQTIKTPSNETTIRTNPTTPKNNIQSSIDFTKSLLTPMKADQQNPIRPVPAKKKSTTTPTNIHTEEYKAYQFFLTYLVLEKDNRLLFIDQHAAAERVRFEQIKEQSKSGEWLSKQQLLIPESFKINSEEFSILSENISQINNLGFETTLKRSEAILKAIPAILKPEVAREAFQEILDELTDPNIIVENGFSKIEQNIIATMACHSSIRAGELLRKEQINQLITDLLNTKLPYSCPHGRPIIWEISKYELEKNFKRKI